MTATTRKRTDKSKHRDDKSKFINSNNGTYNYYYFIVLRAEEFC